MRCVRSMFRLFVDWVQVITRQPRLMRGQGGGHRILRELLAEARGRGLREVHCLSSLNAEAFYANSGFYAGQRCKHRFQNGGEIDCIPMKKMLEPDNAEPDAEFV